MAGDEDVPIFSSSRFFLQLSLMWPLQNEQPKWFYLRLAVFAVLLGLTITLSIGVHIVKSLQEGGIDISEDLAFLATSICLALMMVLYALKQQDLLALMLDLCNFDQFGKPPLFDSVNKMLEFWVKFIFAYCIFGAVFYNVVKIVEIPQCKRSRKVPGTCGSLIQLWTPFDPDDGVTASLVVIYVFLIALIMVKVTLMVSVQVLEISWNIKLRIDQLKGMLLGCFDGDAAASRGRLNHCIQYHIDIISYSERFNKCFTNGMFVHLATTGLVCGCLENQIVKEHQLEAILHICGWIGSIFVSCLGGQLLMDSSTSIAAAAYGSKWYQADVRTRKDLILMILRSQKPLFVATGPFNVMCLALFVSIMKMSYSVLTLLN